MDWRLQAYQQLKLEERPKKKNTPDPNWPECRVLTLFENTVDFPDEEAETIFDQELGDWLKDPKVGRLGMLTSTILTRSKIDQKARVTPKRIQPLVRSITWESILSC